MLSVNLPTATFDVQGESISCNQGVVWITCIFARGSLAKGCLIIIAPVGNHSSTVPPKRALRQESNDSLSQNASHSFDLSVGPYNILILDVEADESVDLMRRLYISVNSTCVLPSLTTAPSILVPGLSVKLVVLYMNGT